MKLKEINLCLNGETETYVDVPEEMVNKVCIQHMHVLLRHTSIPSLSFSLFISICFLFKKSLIIINSI